MSDAATAPLAVHPDHERDLLSRTAVRWLVVANPVAGRAGPDSRAWQRIVQALRAAGVEFDIEWTRARGDGARIAAAALARGQRHLLVAGGDGSLHDVVNGLMSLRNLAGAHASVPVVVPLPLGTGNDWARSLGLPRDPAALAATIARGETVLHDVGRIDLLDSGGNARETCWFINVAGAGFDAHVIERMPARTPSRLAYLLGALRELARYRSPLFRITPDAPADHEGPQSDSQASRKLLAFVANGGYCGNGMHVAPMARIDDGCFDLVTIDALGWLEALPRLARLYNGTLLQDRAARHVRAASVCIAAEPAAGIEADGQFVGCTPARFTVEAKRLRTMLG